MVKSRSCDKNKLDRMFSKSASYSLPASGAQSLRDPCRDKYGFEWRERHLQCVWADSAFRPLLMHSSDGREVIVEHPGQWNLDAGPDFRGAILLVGESRRRVCGDVEVHIRPCEWEAHGHHKDERYKDVVAHVTFFGGKSMSGLLPAKALEISLQPDLQSNPLFSFESIDVLGYPYAERSLPGPCFRAVQRGAVDDVLLLLESAGEERLRIKAERMSIAVTESDPAQVFYEEVLGALGYKGNSVTCRQLGRRVPLHILRSLSDNVPTRAFFLLMGVSGLIPERVSLACDSETRIYVRQMWDFWWRNQHAWESSVMCRRNWQLAGMRPQNHPVRRLVAAAGLFAGSDTILDRVVALPPTDDAKVWIDQALSLFTDAYVDKYWSRRLSLTSRSLSADAILLVGRERALSIICNVVLPFLCATGCAPRCYRQVLDTLPGGPGDSVVKRTAFALLGRDHSPGLYKTALRQQGLLQVFHDYCISDRSGCRDCGFPGLIEGFHG